MHAARDKTGVSTGFLSESAICGVWSAHIHCAALDTSVSGCMLACMCAFLFMFAYVLQ